MEVFTQPIETGIQLGQPTYLTFYRNKILNVMIIRNKKIIQIIPQKLWKQLKITFHNDMISGIFCLDEKKLDYYLNKSNKNLFIRIRRELKKNFELSNIKDYDILTSWIIGTFLFTELKAFPYLHFHAPKGSGKSTVLRCLDKICFNGQMLVNMTPAIARDIDGEKPTLLIDETEELYELRTKSERIQTIKQILNTGYQKGARVSRHFLNKQTNKYQKEFFNVYCPKAFASIREVDSVLRDRCIVINLIRSKYYFKVRSEELKELMHEILAYVIKNYDKILFGLPESMKILQKNKIHGRSLEQLNPIHAIASHFNVDIVEHCKRIAESKTKYEESIQSDEQVLIQALYSLIEKHDVDEQYFDLYQIRDEMKRIYESSVEWLTNHYLGQLMHRMSFNETARRGTTGRIHHLIRREVVRKLVYAYNVSTDWEGKHPQTREEFKNVITVKKLK